MGNGKKVKEQTIKSLSDLFKYNEEVYERFSPYVSLWWRGHSDIKWNLKPKVFRPRDPNIPKIIFRESNLISLFAGRALARHDNPPSKDRDWLFLAQHYGLPTRLLDWTESALIGLYFAVKEVDYVETDGAIWALSPAFLNEAMGGEKGILGPGKKPVLPLFGVAEDKNPPTDNGKVFGINTPHANMRMMLQQSAFTIHGTKRGLDVFDGADKFLVKFRVPNNKKGDLLEELQRFGVSESYLFPELDYLSKDLINDPRNVEEIDE